MTILPCVVHAAGDRRGLGPAVLPRGDHDRVMPDPDELDQLIPADDGIGRDCPGHGPTLAAAPRPASAAGRAAPWCARGRRSGSDATMSAMVTARSDWRQAASASAILAARPQASRHCSRRRRGAALLPDLVARVERRPAVHRLDDLQHRDLVRGPGQPEAAARPGDGGEHARPAPGPAAAWPGRRRAGRSARPAARPMPRYPGRAGRATRWRAGPTRCSQAVSCVLV